jgi:endonuclease/exonuclease/phosphatase family metal-dependent hydrolase
MSIRSKYRILLPLLLAGLASPESFARQGSPETEGKRGDIRIMFYNTENYFDVYDDSLGADEEFLPGSEKDWNKYRYREKTLHLFKTIAAVGEKRPPEIVCFAEVENKNVLYELVKNTPLEKYPMEVVHFDSPDQRGIDVGLIFHSDRVEKIAARKIPVTFPEDPYRTTRDILYFKASVLKSDTIHLFVNHWPSRRGGQKASEPYRIAAALILKAKTDSLLNCNPYANIIITGDFNDEPYDESLSQAMAAQTQIDTLASTSLYNLSAIHYETCKCGTYRYGALWNMLDQFIVSGGLLGSWNTLHTCIGCLHIAQFDFLLVEDNKYGGTKPFRTYQGPIYKGGFSDHLPVYLDLFY